MRDMSHELTGKPSLVAWSMLTVASSEELDLSMRKADEPPRSLELVRASGLVRLEPTEGSL